MFKSVLPNLPARAQSSWRGNIYTEQKNKTILEYLFLASFSKIITLQEFRRHKMTCCCKHTVQWMWYYITACARVCEVSQTDNQVYAHNLSIASHCWHRFWDSCIGLDVANWLKLNWRVCKDQPWRWCYSTKHELNWIQFHFWYETENQHENMNFRAEARAQIQKTMLTWQKSQTFLITNIPRRCAILMRRSLKMVKLKYLQLKMQFSWGSSILFFKCTQQATHIVLIESEKAAKLTALLWMFGYVMCTQFVCCCCCQNIVYLAPLAVKLFCMRFEMLNKQKLNGILLGKSNGFCTDWMVLTRP